MSNPNDKLLVKVFGRWWVYDQSQIAEPPKIPQDILELADIVYWPPRDLTIKNRYNESFEGPITMRMWLGNHIPDLNDREFRDVYVDYIQEMGRRMREP